MRKILALILIVVMILGVCSCSKKNTYEPSHQMVESHVFVCDNPKNKSDFDLWMMKEDGVGLNWVPSYLICTQGKVLGVIRGDIPLEDFKTQYDFIVTSPIDSAFDDFCEYDIQNLNGNRYKLIDFMPADGNVYVLEISWATCPDCIHQDENYTQDIYNAYDTQFFYRYYINTELSEVQALVQEPS